jgi:two-component system sensor histidine kinase KdpD
VRVTVKQRDGSVEIAVEDQGKGIPLKMRGRIFDKFVRLDEQDIHRTGSGLGLGLAIAKGIVESQGGTITVGDGPDGFATRFAVKLPAAEA